MKHGDERRLGPFSVQIHGLSSIPHDSMPGRIYVGVGAPLLLGGTVGNLTHLGGGAVIVQHAAQSLAPLDHAWPYPVVRFRNPRESLL
jgi:hypothetical protein